ncbi:MAG: DUF664 domain-containing protein [Acidimicrobiales bacterium]
MTDRKPPRTVGDERSTLLELLQFQRESMVRKVEGLDDGAVARSPVASGTTLLWLLLHLAAAESLWVEHRIAGGAVVVPEGDGTVAGAVDAYRQAWARVDPILSSAPLDDPCATTDGESSVTVRWVLAHLLEETARHAGHADILRELLDGATGR